MAAGERGEFAQAGDPTFASAALDYMRAGGERLYLRPILEHFHEQPLCTIRQAEIDAAAEAIGPGRSAATRNRQVYTPISAVLRHAGVALPPYRFGSPRSLAAPLVDPGEERRRCVFWLEFTAIPVQAD